MLAVCEVQTNTLLGIKALKTLESLGTLRLVQGKFTASKLPSNLTELKLRSADLHAGSHFKI